MFFKNTQIQNFHSCTENESISNLLKFVKEHENEVVESSSVTSINDDDVEHENSNEDDDNDEDETTISSISVNPLSEEDEPTDEKNIVAEEGFTVSNKKNWMSIR